KFEKRSKELAVAAYLEKPISQSGLLDAIVTALQPKESKPLSYKARSAPSRRQEPVPIPAAVCPLRVLLAEDTPANQKLVQAILTKRGHTVEIARNGREAIHMVKQGTFDVVLMDVQMPGVDGFQATAAIRKLAESAKARIPIIAMTAH